MDRTSKQKPTPYTKAWLLFSQGRWGKSLDTCLTAPEHVRADAGLAPEPENVSLVTTNMSSGITPKTQPINPNPNAQAHTQASKHASKSK